MLVHLLYTQQELVHFLRRPSHSTTRSQRLNSHAINHAEQAILLKIPRGGELWHRRIPPADGNIKMAKLPPLEALSLQNLGHAIIIYGSRLETQVLPCIGYIFP